MPLNYKYSSLIVDFQIFILNLALQPFKLTGHYGHSYTFQMLSNKYLKLNNI